MIASGRFAGVYDLDWVLGQTDDDGLTYGELVRIGYDGAAAVGGRDLDSYFELHIEQGPILEAEGVPLGIVTKGYTTHGMHVDVFGETAHSGPTPMDKRRNALVGAALLAVRVNEIGWEHHDSDGKSTVPRLVLLAQQARHPAGIRPGDGRRAPSGPGHRRPHVRRRRGGPGRLCREGQCRDDAGTTWTFGDEVFDPELIQGVKAAAEALSVPCREIFSQAGHDAYHISKIAPTALLFTPCKDSITHNEAEHIEPDYTFPGVNVLLNAVLAPCRPLATAEPQEERVRARSL